MKLKAEFNPPVNLSSRWLFLVLVCACGTSPGSEPVPDAPTDGPPSTVVNAFDVPITGLSREDTAKFNDGDALFGLLFRAPDGLGPLFIRASCAACHIEGTRGPGLVQKVAIVEADGITPAADQSALPYGHTLRGGLAGGGMTPIRAPDDANAKVTQRVGPPVLGRGYIEAVDEAELMRLEAEQAARSDGIHGKVGRGVFESVPNPDTTYGSFAQGQAVIGKLGLKSRIATIDDFTADAFQGDMGLTTPMRPVELANPDKRSDDDRTGVDLTLEHINRVSFYLRRIAIPVRVGLTERGAQLFEATACAACHVPTLRTRADYPIPQLAGIDAPIYSDLLLHDMGPALADGQTDGGASSSSWRTAPLIGLRFVHNYLHDARAHSVAEAILAHDGEARGAAQAFQALSQEDQRTLTEYVEAL